MIDEEGNVVIAATDESPEVDYDTLPNGKIIPKQLPNTIKYIPITKDDTAMRRNFMVADNTDIGDGDKNSTRFYDEEDDTFKAKPSMYNSPKPPTTEIDSLGQKNVINDEKRRTTLISNKTRVYKGGSWSDREYWLDPAQRRYLPEYMATNYIGFRCVSDKVGPMTTGNKTARNPNN
jgi:gliding motility-associated lipoprotein GldJ